MIAASARKQRGSQKLGDFSGAAGAHIAGVEFVGNGKRHIPQRSVVVAAGQLIICPAQDRVHIRQRAKSRALRHVLQPLLHEGVDLAADISLRNVGLHGLGRGQKHRQIRALVRRDIDLQPQIFPQLHLRRHSGVKVKRQSALRRFLKARYPHKSKRAQFFFSSEELDAALHSGMSAAVARAVFLFCQNGGADVAAGNRAGQDLHFFHSSPALSTSSSYSQPLSSSQKPSSSSTEAKYSSSL